MALEQRAGLCECGCGHPTRIAHVTDRARNWTRGEPVKFIKGHYRRNEVVSRYRVVTVDGKNVTLHRLRAERALGKPLPAGAVVHHADGSTSDTAPLVICQDDAYHALLHGRMRVRAAGGDPNTHKLCGRCRRAKPFDEFHKHKGAPDGLHYCCRECHCDYQRAAHHRRRAERRVNAG